MLRPQNPDFPSCLCWADEAWSGTWHGTPNRILIEQTYPGLDAHRAHFEALLSAFRDGRYIRVGGKPMFLSYKPEKLPEPKASLATWQAMAVQAGFPGLHIVGMSADVRWSAEEHGFGAKVAPPLVRMRRLVSRRQPVKWARRWL